MLSEQADDLLSTPLRSVAADSFKGIHDGFHDCIVMLVCGRIRSELLKYEAALKDEISENDGKLTMT